PGNRQGIRMRVHSGDAGETAPDGAAISRATGIEDGRVANLQRAVGFGGDRDGWNGEAVFLPCSDRESARGKFGVDCQRRSGASLSGKSRYREQCDLPAMRVFTALQNLDHA